MNQGAQQHSLSNALKLKIIGERFGWSRYC